MTNDLTLQKNVYPNLLLFAFWEQLSVCSLLRLEALSELLSLRRRFHRIDLLLGDHLRSENPVVVSTLPKGHHQSASGNRDHKKI